MNTEHMIVLGVALAPAVLGLVLRVNSVLVFLSVVSGYLLQQTLGDSAGLTISSLSKSSQSDMIANIGLLFLPVILTLIIARKTLKASNVLFQLLPLVLASGTGAAFLLPLTSDLFRVQAYSGVVGAQIYSAADVVVAAAAILNLLLAWRLYRQADEHKHHGKNFH